MTLPPIPAFSASAPPLLAPPSAATAAEAEADAALAAAVPGAFVIRGALTPAECEQWRRYVLALHEEEAPTGEGSGPRRGSQHHVPCRAGPEALRPLCARLRSALPAAAGPGSSAALAPPGEELSPFLRCYYYRRGERSAPHFDRSFREHAVAAAVAAIGGGGDPSGGRAGRLVRFSAFSVVVYLDDGFEGGETTFFHAPPPEAVSRSRSTLVASYDEAPVRPYIVALRQLI